MEPQAQTTPRRRGRLARFIAFAALLLAMPIFVFGATIAATGTVSVSVHDRAEGLDLWIPVPAILIDLALFAAPRLIPEEALAEARQEVAPYRDTLRTLAAELENIPSRSVLVEVHDGDEHVLVTKSRRSYEVRVDSPDTDVRVSIPARLVHRSFALLD